MLSPFLQFVCPRISPDASILRLEMSSTTLSPMITYAVFCLGVAW